MSPEDIDAFLQRPGPALVGVMGTARSDGAPHVVPVWYRWDGEAVHVWTGENRQWVRNVRREPRAAFSVQEMTAPFAAAVMRGRASIRSGTGTEIDDEIRRIAARYLDGADIDPYVRAWPALRTIVDLVPDRLTGWGRGY